MKCCPNKASNYFIFTIIVMMLLFVLSGCDLNNLTRKENPMIVVSAQDNVLDPVTYDEVNAHTFEFMEVVDGIGEVSYELISCKDEEFNDVDYFTLVSLDDNQIKVKGGTPAGTYTLTIRAYATGDDDYKEASEDITYIYKIDKKESMMIEPVAMENLVYNEHEQNLVVPGSSMNGTVLYKVNEDGEYSEDIPKATDAGVYVVYYKLEGDKNHKDIEEESLVVTIERQSSGMRPSTASYSSLNLGGYLSYLDSHNTLPVHNRSRVTGPNSSIVERTYNGQIQYNGYSKPSGVVMVGDDSGINAGTYVAVYTPDFNHCWSDGTYGPVSVTMVIARKSVGPKPDREIEYTYDGLEHNNGYEVPEGVIMTGFEKGTDVGTYVAIYTPERNYRWEEGTFEPVKVTLTINKAEPVFTYDDVTLYYNGHLQPLLSGVNVEGGTISYSTNGLIYSGIVPYRMNAGTYTIYYKIYGDRNHEDASGNIDITINKRLISIPYTESHFVYDGIRHVPEIENGDLRYMYFVDSTLSARDAGEYTINAKLYDSDNNEWEDHTTDDVTLIWIIEKADGVIDKHPVAKELVYNGTYQQTVEPGRSSSGRIMYKIDDGNFTHYIPTAKNAGEYTIYYYAQESDNYKATDVYSLKVTIDKAEPVIDVEPHYFDEPLIYNGKLQKLLVPGETKHGTFMYRFYSFSPNYPEYSEEIPEGRYVLVYAIQWYVKGDDNHYDSPVETAISYIGLGRGVLDEAPQARTLQYTGDEQELLTPGSSDTGNVVYRLKGEDEWSESIPTAVEVGNYTIEAKAEENENYDASEIVSVKASISNADLIVEADNQEYTYNGESQGTPVLVTTADGSDAKVEYYTGRGFSEEVPSFEETGEYKITYRINAPSHNPVDGKYTIRIDKRQFDKPELSDEEVVYDGEVKQPELLNYDESVMALSRDTSEVNAGDYRVDVSLTDTRNNEWSDGSQNKLSVEWSIEKAPVNLEVPQARALRYTGTSQELITSGSVEGGKLVYSSGERKANNIIPMGTQVGTYTVYYSVNPDNNHIGVDPTPISVEIKPALIEVEIENQEYLFDGERHGEGVVARTVNNIPYTVRYGTAAGEYDFADVPSFSAAGTRTYYYAVEANNHETYYGSYTVSIKAAPGVIESEPVINSGNTYTGEEIPLLKNPGYSSTGTILYSVNGSEYSEELPVERDAGSYHISYYSKGDENHTDTEIREVEVVIHRYEVDAPVSENFVFDYNGYPQGPDVYGYDESVMIISGNEETDAGNYELRIGLRDRINYQWSDGTDSDVVYNWTINKVDPYFYNYPVNYSSLFNGENQRISEDVYAEGGKVVYSLDGVNFSDNLYAYNAGEYVVTYRIEGDENHNDLDGGTYTFVIEKGYTYFTVLPEMIEGLEYNGSSQVLITPAETSLNGSYVEYSLDNETYSRSLPEAIDAGIYEIYYRIPDTDNWYGSNIGITYGYISILVEENVEIELETESKYSEAAEFDLSEYVEKYSINQLLIKENDYLFLEDNILKLNEGSPYGIYELGIVGVDEGDNNHTGKYVLIKIIWKVDVDVNQLVENTGEIIQIEMPTDNTEEPVIEDGNILAETDIDDMTEGAD